MLFKWPLIVTVSIVLNLVVNSSQMNLAKSVSQGTCRREEHNLYMYLLFVASIRAIKSLVDSMLSMETHMNKVCSSGFYYLHNLRRLRRYLSQDCLVTLIHAFVTSRLDYCNSLMYGLPQCQISKLQRVQNAAARIALDLSKFCHIIPALRQLHWLPVVKRIQFKILLLTFKAINGLSPPYISELKST